MQDVEDMGGRLLDRRCELYRIAAEAVTDRRRPPEVAAFDTPAEMEAALAAGLPGADAAVYGSCAAVPDGAGGVAVYKADPALYSMKPTCRVGAPGIGSGELAETAALVDMETVGKCRDGRWDARLEDVRAALGAQHAGRMAAQAAEDAGEKWAGPARAAASALPAGASASIAREAASAMASRRFRRELLVNRIMELLRADDRLADAPDAAVRSAAWQVVARLDVRAVASELWRQVGRPAVRATVPRGGDAAEMGIGDIVDARAVEPMKRPPRDGTLAWDPMPDQTGRHATYGNLQPAGQARWVYLGMQDAPPAWPADIASVWPWAGTRAVQRADGARPRTEAAPSRRNPLIERAHAKLPAKPNRAR